MLREIAGHSRYNSGSPRELGCWKRVGFVFWAKSQLFWKIVGLYVLLSVLALVGLVVTLNARIHDQDEKLQTSQASLFVDGVINELQVTEADRAISIWSRSLSVHGYQVWLVDEQGKSRLKDSVAVPVRAAIQSAVRTAFRSEKSTRWLQSPNDQNRKLVMVKRCQPIGLPLSAVLLVGDLGLGAERGRVFSDAATRGAVFTWLIGVLVVGFIAMGLVVPLRVMTDNLGSEVERTQRQDMLMRISDRHDELGSVAQSFTELEEERQDRIAELQDSEKISRSTVNLLTAVLDSMIEGVIAIDEDERILFLNAAARRLLSISNAIGLQHRLYEAVRVPSVLDTVSEAITTGDMQTLEFRTTREGLHLAMVVNPIRKGSHAGAVAVVRDISELRRLEAMRRDFVSGVSHELKTPLTVIQACTDTLLDGAVDDPEVARRFLKQVDEQSERLLQLILGMLQLARVESGSEVFQFEPVDLREVVEEVIAAMQPVVEARTISLKSEGLQQLIVICDWQAVRTIISNLTDNAIKHTPDGGTVTLQLTNDSDGPGIIVRDNGAGIPAEHLSRIFERFYRVDRDRSRDRGGTGLGLAIVKHLCQPLQATVSVASSPGTGTEFRVIFRKELFQT